MYVFAEEEFISAFEVEFITNPRQQNKKKFKTMWNILDSLN